MGMANFECPAGVLERSSPKGGSDETYISAEPSSSPAGTWLSKADEEPSRPRHFEAASCQGTPTTRCNGAVEIAVGIRTGPFKRADRLARPEDFARVRRYGRPLRLGSFVILVADRVDPGSGEGVRLGITVSRRVGKAVIRNRVKRRIREWFRHERAQMQGNLDIVVIARPVAGGLSARETVRALEQGARAAGVVV